MVCSWLTKHFCATSRLDEPKPKAGADLRLPSGWSPKDERGVMGGEEKGEESGAAVELNERPFCLARSLPLPKLPES